MSFSRFVKEGLTEIEILYFLKSFMKRRLVLKVSSSEKVNHQITIFVLHWRDGWKAGYKKMFDKKYDINSTNTIKEKERKGKHKRFLFLFLTNLNHVQIPHNLCSL